MSADVEPTVATPAVAAQAVDAQAVARQTYRHSLTANTPLTGKALGAMFGKSDRWGRLVIAEVRNEPQPATTGPPPSPERAAGAVPRSPRQPNPAPETATAPETEMATALEMATATQPTATATARAAAVPATAERKPGQPAGVPLTAGAEPRGYPPVADQHAFGSRHGPAAAPTAVAAAQAPPPHSLPRARSISTWFFVLGALVGMAVSVDTSWRFFQLRVGVSNVTERVCMFAGIEILLLGCGWAMFEGVRGPRRAPGPARWLAWALCAASGYAALTLSGWPIGPARVLFGPVLSVVALHFALGIELRAAGQQRAGTLARVGREVRERVLSRLGLADDTRPAWERTRARAARRAAHLAHVGGWVPRRTARLHRALRVADVAHDPRQRQRLLAELRILQHATDLRGLRQSSPWQPDSAPTTAPTSATTAAAAMAVTAAAESRPGPETGAPSA